jgi:hypothetical protein
MPIPPPRTESGSLEEDEDEDESLAEGFFCSETALKIRLNISSKALTSRAVMACLRVRARPEVSVLTVRRGLRTVVGRRGGMSLTLLKTWSQGDSLVANIESDEGGSLFSEVSEGVGEVVKLRVAALVRLAPA